MTSANVGGRPRIFDEDHLIERIEGFEDLVLIKAALVQHSSHPTWARGNVSWLWSKKMGDPSGGVSRSMAYEYRRMLAELPFDPLRPPGGRRRALRELAREHGSAHLAVVGSLAAAGILAISSQTGCVALCAVGTALGPIMPVMSTSSGVAGRDGDAADSPHEAFTGMS